MASQELIDRTLTKYSALLQQAARDSGLEVSFLPGTAVYEVLVKPAGVLFAEMLDELEDFADNNTLRGLLSSPNPDPEQILNVLSNYNYAPREGTPASGILTIRSSTSRNIYIAQTTKVTCNGVELLPRYAYIATAPGNAASDTQSLRYVEYRALPDGTFVFGIEVTAVDLQGKVLYAGQACTMDIQDSAVTQVRLGTTIQDNAPAETPEQLLERAQTSMNAHVVTGRDNIRAMLLNDSGYPVTDVRAIGFTDPEMLRSRAHGFNVGGCADVYVSTAVVPSVTVAASTAYRQADGTYLARIPQEVAGAYGVLSAEYGTLYSAYPEMAAGEPSVGDSRHLIESARDARWSAYQVMSVRLPATWSSENEIPVNLSVLHMPDIAGIQAFLDLPGVRSAAIDLVAKAVCAFSVGLRVSVIVPEAPEVPDAEDFENAIRDYVNARSSESGDLYSSEIAGACQALYPGCVAVTPMRMTLTAWDLDGKIHRQASATSLKFPVLDGISGANAAMFCMNDVEVTVRRAR